MFNDLPEEEVYGMVIWSADVPNVPTLLGHLDRMPRLRRIKIDRLFIDTNGFEILHVLRDRGYEVFEDAKFVEVPSKLEGLAKLHCSHRPWMLNCMAGNVSSGVLGGLDPEKVDGLKRFADVCHQYDVKPCAVTVLTSKEPPIVATEFNGRTPIEQVNVYSEFLRSFGFTDIVCSPLELPIEGLDCNTPGVRPEGAETGDQARTDTPAAALRNGAKRVVIGRPITNGDPAVNLDNIVRSILAAA